MTNDTKTALVTGANKGIGHAIAAGLGALSYRVGVGARDASRREAAVGKLRADGVDAFGVIRVINAMLPLLLRSPAPRIVNVSSTLGSVTRQADADADAGPIMGVYAPSKSFLNALTVQYARHFAGTNLLINAVCPGLVATDFNGFQASRTPEQGAAVVLRMATLPDGGPTGTFMEDAGALPW
ncbi:SDR family NAD(P)-dependent oxidoreductase [Nonomuraea sp. NPDC049421]|uniref:SDR family NAD(P)-dependent oxidoreductase n=1 Tax=Nonomuraea sp. NPDC049421 TaxID=3155275 RepID=UPI0034172B29